MRDYRGLLAPNRSKYPRVGLNTPYIGGLSIHFVSFNILTLMAQHGNMHDLYFFILGIRNL